MVMSTCCSCRGSRFDSRQPHGSLQLLKFHSSGARGCGALHWPVCNCMHMLHRPCLLTCKHTVNTYKCSNPRAHENKSCQNKQSNFFLLSSPCPSPSPRSQPPTPDYCDYNCPLMWLLGTKLGSSQLCGRSFTQRHSLSPNTLIIRV